MSVATQEYNASREEGEVIGVWNEMRTGSHAAPMPDFGIQPSNYSLHSRPSMSGFLLYLTSISCQRKVERDNTTLGFGSWFRRYPAHPVLRKTLPYQPDHLTKKPEKKRQKDPQKHTTPGLSLGEAFSRI